MTEQKHTPVRIRDARGAQCECGAYFDYFTNQAVPWSWRQSQLMHERGTGHRMELLARA